ncbi:glycine zipper domain-containing protein, partial [Klebsiella pneumoniae]|uniref:glycine zipper domain-containing protein n=1 Tax=Klebsiella pneumoniae TaxID=573 RepID=UPI00396B66ED
SLIVDIDEIKTTTTGIIKQVVCHLVAKDNSIAGATIGGTVGAAAGAAVGKALLGKSGSWIGGLIGGAVGGAIGNNMAATETYQ